MSDTSGAWTTAREMPDMLEYWTDKQVDRRNADLRITPERK